MTTTPTPPAGPLAAECQRIQANAAGLASLDERDVERRAAFAHAADCQPCRAALTEGEQLMRLLDAEAKATERPSAVVMARVSSEILASLDRETERARPRRSRSWRGTAVPVAVLSAVWLATGLIRLAAATHPLPGGDRAGASVAMIALTTLGAAGALLLGGWLTPLLPAASLLMSLLHGGGGGHQAAIGVSCAGFELLFAVLPVIVAGLLVRRGGLTSPTTSLAIAAGGGALVAQSVLHAICHAHPSTAHNFLFHTGPVFLALLLGGLAGRRLPLRR
jgi:hypothetical protein